MTEMRSLLALAADDPPVGSGTVDDDVKRGRRALRRRRAGRLAAPMLVAVVGATALVISQPGIGSSPDEQAVRGPAASDAPTADGPAPIELVAYHGAQPSGYTVASVPDGWEIQGANPFAMTIAPKGYGDTEPDSFVGKLVVMLRSADDTGTPPGARRPVGDGIGYLNHTEGVAVLTYQDRAQHWLQLQVPPTLHWSDEKIAEFGAGVEVTRDAQAGRG